MIEAALYLVGLPIGNLEDITLRALRILREVDFIACEDTRRTLKLLNYYEIKKRLVSCHAYNEKQKVPFLTEEIKKGKSVAFVVDSGMPLISDPGALLVSEALQMGIKITVIPGPSALVAAGVLSGFFMDKFTFYGFLPKKGKVRKEMLSLISQSSIPSIIYESPQRISLTLLELSEYCDPDREIAVAKELTKLNENVYKISFKDINEFLKTFVAKGEFVLVVGPR